jgi:hypothetical protein
LLDTDYRKTVDKWAETVLAPIAKHLATIKQHAAESVFWDGWSSGDQGNATKDVSPATWKTSEFFVEMLGFYEKFHTIPLKQSELMIDVRKLVDPLLVDGVFKCPTVQRQLSLLMQACAASCKKLGEPMLLVEEFVGMEKTSDAEIGLKVEELLAKLNSNSQAPYPELLCSDPSWCYIRHSFPASLFRRATSLYQCLGGGVCWRVADESTSI